PGHRAGHDQAGRYRGDRARCRGPHRMARPCRGPGRTRSAARPHRRSALSTPHPPAGGTRIMAMGHYQPSRVLTNDDLARMVDTNDQWIRERVGIVNRRVADTATDDDLLDAAHCTALH